MGCLDFKCSNMIAVFYRIIYTHIVRYITINQNIINYIHYSQLGLLLTTTHPDSVCISPYKMLGYAVQILDPNPHLPAEVSIHPHNHATDVLDVGSPLGRSVCSSKQDVAITNNW